MAHISQREAHRLRARVWQLEQELRATWDEWRPSFMPGVLIATEPNATVEAQTAIRTARKLKCRVIAVADDSQIRFYAKRYGDATVGE